MKNGGFTLMELVVVMILFSLVLAIVYPSLNGSIERTRMEGAVRDIAALLKYSREKATAEQEAIAVTIRRVESDLTIFGADNAVIQHYQPDTRIKFAQLMVDGQESPDNQVVIWFYPDGRSSGVAMVLKDENNRQFRLKTDILTGSTKVYAPGDKGFEDEIFRQ